MLIQYLVAFAFLLGQKLFFTVDGAEHSIRGLQQQECGIIDFSLYNPGNQSLTPLNAYDYKARIRLDQYKDGKINIVANVGKSCTSGTKTRCVKLDFAGDKRKERIIPYALYGDQVGGQLYSRRPKLSGWQTMSAIPYSDSNCTKILNGSLSVDIHVVPNSTVAFPASKYSLLFQSTTGPVTTTQTNATNTAVCDYLREAAAWLVYKRTYRYKDFKCKGTPKINAKPLQIDYVISLKYTVNDDVGPYDPGFDVPNVTVVNDWFTNVFNSKQNNGPNYPKLYDKLLSILPSNNPYAKATSLGLA